MNQNQSYTIVRAEGEIRKEIISSFWRDDKPHDESVILAAVNEAGARLGYISAKTIDASPCGWFIQNIRVNPECKCQGIGTALFRELEKLASENGVSYFHGWASPSLEATMFWQKLGFVMYRISRIHDSSRIPDTAFHRCSFGRYSHYMFRNTAPLPPISVNKAVTIRTASCAQIDEILADPPNTVNKDYLERKKDEFFGYLAFDDENGATGYALMLYEPMYPPLSEMMLVFWIYVKPEYRRSGIGCALVNKVMEFAAERGISQIYHVGKYDELPFWQTMNFHTHIQKSSKPEDKYIVFAGLRL